MNQIASKNQYELLGNDPELDPDREPEPPTKVIDKPVQRTGKRNAGTEGPAPAREGPTGGRGGRGGRSEGFFRGDQAPLNNRADDGLRTDRHPRGARGGRGRGDGERGRGRGRGGRGGGTYRDTRDDRQSHTGLAEHDKQAAKGWGGEDGQAELDDEKAGEAIARAESKDQPGFTPDTSAADPAFSNGPDGVTGEEDAAPAEPEDKTKSYDQYLAEQAEKRLALGGESLAIRQANEGSKQKFPQGKAFSRDPDSENFFVGSGGKHRKEKDIGSKKETVTLDGQYYAPYEQDRGGRGGRGRGRGGFPRGDRGGEGRGRGRGGFRGGDRGDRGDRGERGDRGDRGERGGSRGGPRGGFNASDNAAFPALGS